MPGDVSFSPKTQALIYAPLISTQRLWTSAVKVYCIIHKTETALFLIGGKNESVLTNIDKCIVTHKF